MEGDRVTATRDTCRKYREVPWCGFWDVPADRQTDMQTRSSQYFAPLSNDSIYTERSLYLWYHWRVRM